MVMVKEGDLIMLIVAVQVTSPGHQSLIRLNIISQPTKGGMKLRIQ